MSRIVAKGVPGTPHDDRTRAIRQSPNQLQRRLPEVVMEQVVADYLAGTSARACAKKYGISAHTVLYNLRARGITPRPAPTAMPTGEKLTRALELRAQGWSYDAIGQEFGLSHTAVRSAILAPQHDQTACDSS